MYEAAILILALLALLCTAACFASRFVAWLGYRRDCSALKRAIEAGDYNAISSIGERVRQYETARRE